MPRTKGLRKLAMRLQQDAPDDPVGTMLILSAFARQYYPNDRQIANELADAVGGMANTTLCRCIYATVGGRYDETKNQ